MKFLWIISIFLLSGFFYSCTKESEEVKNITADTTKKNSGGISAGGVEFKVEYDKPRTIYSIENKDLDNDGNDEIIVLSVVKDEPGDRYMDYYNFDLMQVFAMDAEGKEYVKIISDTIDFGETLTYEDLQKNFTYQMLIKTNTGGNDVYASKGMFVYDMKPGNNLKMIKYIEYGNPEVKDLNSDGKNEIIVTDSYKGIMTGPDVVYYTKDVYRFEDGELKRRNAEFKKYYDEKIDAALAKYEDDKTKLKRGEKIKPAEYPLYFAAVNIFVNYMAEENNSAIINFWNSEKDFLKKSLPQEQYSDLENFITHITPVVENF